MDNGRRIGRAVTRMVAGLLLAGAAAARVAAQDWLVETTLDVVANDGFCGLREAYENAAQGQLHPDCAIDDASPNRILLSDLGPYTWNQGVEIVGAGDQLAIEGTIGPPFPTIDLGGVNPFFSVQFGGRLAMDNVAFTNGSGGSFTGGTISVLLGNLTLDNVSFLGSTAPSGGALSIAAGPGNLIVLRNVTGDDTVAFRTTAAEPAQGGFLNYFGGGDARLEVRGLRVTGARAENTAAGGLAEGGALAIGGTGTASVYLHQLEITDSVAVAAAGTANGNVAKFLLDASATINQTGIAVRYSTISGYALADFDLEALLSQQSRLRFGVGSRDVVAPLLDVVRGGSRMVISNEALAEMHNAIWAQAEGGGMLTQGPVVDAVVVELSGTASFAAGHLTIAGHTGAGLSVTNSGTGSARIENSILWGNGDDLETSGAVSFDPVANRNTIGELGSADPLFVDPAAGDFTLQAASPARDTGDATFVTVGAFDANHAPRVAGPETDRGAFEFGAIFGWDGEEGDLVDWSVVSGGS